MCSVGGELALHVLSCLPGATKDRFRWSQRALSCWVICWCTIVTILSWAFMLKNGGYGPISVDSALAITSGYCFYSQSIVRLTRFGCARVVQLASDAALTLASPPRLLLGPPRAAGLCTPPRSRLASLPRPAGLNRPYVWRLAGAPPEPDNQKPPLPRPDHRAAMLETESVEA